MRGTTQTIEIQSSSVPDWSYIPDDTIEKEFDAVVFSGGNSEWSALITNWTLAKASMKRLVQELDFKVIWVPLDEHNLQPSCINGLHTLKHESTLIDYWCKHGWLWSINYLWARYASSVFNKGHELDQEGNTTISLFPDSGLGAESQLICWCWPPSTHNNWSNFQSSILHISVSYAPTEGKGTACS